MHSYEYTGMKKNLTIRCISNTENENSIEYGASYRGKATSGSLLFDISFLLKQLPNVTRLSIV